MTLQSKNEHEEAEALFRRSLDIYHQLTNKDDDDRQIEAVIASNLAAAMNTNGKTAAAQSLIRTVLEKLNQESSSEPWLSNNLRWLVGNARSVLGACLVEKGHYEEAESLLLEAYDIVEEERGRQDYYTGNALRRVALLYEKWGEGEKAARYLSMAESGPQGL